MNKFGLILDHGPYRASFVPAIDDINLIHMGQNNLFLVLIYHVLIFNILVQQGLVVLQLKMATGYIILLDLGSDLPYEFIILNLTHIRKNRKEEKNERLIASSIRIWL
ncbi:hypothetical protein ACJX0J_032440, partial [Zea mays]